MNLRQLRPVPGRWMVVVLALCTGAGTLLAQSGPDTLSGRRLEDALRVLQTRGLRVVFSSEMVTPDMRVRAEPRAKRARDQLDELLEPHGLVAESGPGGVIQVVRGARPVAGPPPRDEPPIPPKKAEPEPKAPSAAGTVYRERVTVTGDLLEPTVSAGSPRSLGLSAMRDLGGYLADDPLRIVQMLPGVAGGDDFRSEYSVRGSPYHHAGVVVDGVSAPWLQHAALGRGDTGTLTMLPGDIVQDATLHVGAYARRDGGQLGPQLNLTLREGSRTERRFSASASRTSAMMTAEGPLSRASRGSWLVSFRRSHVEWPVGRDDHQLTVFGFNDVQSKLVYDVRPGQQISLSLVGGVSNVERDDPNPAGLSDGINRAAMASLAWRSIIGSRTIITQRLSTIAHDYLNRDQSTRPASRGSNGADAYRIDLTRSFFRGVVETGGQVRRVRGSRRGASVRAPFSAAVVEPWILADVDGSWAERSGYASFRRSIGAGLTLAAGLRVADSTLVDRSGVDRWVEAEWQAGPWRLHGSTGVMYQLPALEHVRGWDGTAPLRPERAAYADVGVGQRLTPSVRWDATLFARRERDALREPDVHPRLIAGALSLDGVTARYENALTGSARGIEVSVERRSATGFSGWLGYAYGIARHTDTIRRETFDADFDQRHSINASALVPLPWRARVALAFRGGSNFPIPGYFDASGDRLFAGAARNQARLPAYARLDVRAERTFGRRARRFTLFAEALNVLNRSNVGLADGVIRRDTGEAIGFTEQLFPRILTAGVRIQF